MSDLTQTTQNETQQTPVESQPVKSSSFKMRLRALIVLAGVSALIGAAIYLDPNQLEQHKNHYALLKPCSMLVKTGYPCPTCYMTRAFAYMYHGRPDKAFAAQPFGALLSLMTVYLAYGSIMFWSGARDGTPSGLDGPANGLLRFLSGHFLRDGLSNSFMVHLSRTNFRYITKKW
jgi:hypothetical protein